MVINVDRPYHQWAIDDMQTLLAARYDAVLQRLLYPETGNEAFTTVIHEAANNAECVAIEDGEYFMMDCSSPKNFFTLRRSVHTLKSQESDICEDMTPSAISSEGVVDLKVASMVDRDFGVFVPLAQLQWLVCFALIGARNKPRVEDVRGVLQQEMPDARPRDLAFRRAVRALTSRAIDPKEEETLSRNVNKFEAQLEHPVYKEGAKAKLNRYHQGIVARRLLAALLHPFTTAQHLQDELDVIYNKVEPAYAPQTSRPDGRVPTVTLPWPILPPGERQSAAAPQKIENRSPRGESRQKRVLDPLRTRWLGSVAARWPYGAKFAKVELHNKFSETTTDPQGKSGDRSRYRAAILKGPDGKVFAVIADSTIAFPENAMYVGIVRQLRNDQGQAVSWRHVFKGAKNKARKYGAHQFRHTKQDVHKRALDYVCEVFEEQYGFAAALRRPTSRAT